MSFLFHAGCLWRRLEEARRSPMRRAERAKLKTQRDDLIIAQQARDERLSGFGAEDDLLPFFWFGAPMVGTNASRHRRTAPRPEPFPWRAPAH